MSRTANYIALLLILSLRVPSSALLPFSKLHRILCRVHLITFNIANERAVNVGRVPNATRTTFLQKFGECAQTSQSVWQQTSNSNSKRGSEFKYYNLALSDLSKREETHTYNWHRWTKSWLVLIEVKQKHRSAPLVRIVCTESCLENYDSITIKNWSPANPLRSKIAQIFEKKGPISNSKSRASPEASTHFLIFSSFLSQCEAPFFQTLARLRIPRYRWWPQRIQRVSLTMGFQTQSITLCIQRFPWHNCRNIININNHRQQDGL